MKLKKVLLASTLLAGMAMATTASAGNGPLGLVTGIGGALDDGVAIGNSVGVETQHQLRGLGIFGDIIGAAVGLVAGAGATVVTYPKNVVDDAAG